MRLLKRAVHLAGGPSVMVGVGEPLASVSHAQASVARAFILAGALALAGALLAALLIGTRVSRPLRRMAASPRASMPAICSRGSTIQVARRKRCAC